MASSANNGKSEGKSFAGQFTSGLLEKLDDRLFRRKTVGDTNRRVWVTIGALAGAFTSARLCALGVSGCADPVIHFCLISAGAAVGQLCSLFTEELIKRLLPRNVLFRDEMEERIRLIKESSLRQKEKQFLIRREVYTAYKRKVARPADKKGASRPPAER